MLHKNYYSTLTKSKANFVFLSFLLGIFTVCVYFPTPALSSQLSSISNNYDSVIVIPKKNASTSRRMNRIIDKYGIERFQEVKEDIYLIPLNDNDNKELKISELKQSRLFRSVEPNYKLSLDAISSERKYIEINKYSMEESLDLLEVTPNDEGFAFQYYLKEINATKAWNTTIGNLLPVAILDTGVDVMHPDLAGKLLDESDLNNSNFKDEIGHGTGVAGIIAANTNNNQGVAGIAWNAKIVPMKITNENGEATISTVVTALDQAYEKGIMIVQISLSTNMYSEILKEAIKEAQDRDILIISSSGNSGIQEPRYPAAFDGVIGVGAVNQFKQIESYSTTGEHITLVAPGNSICTISPDSSYISASGTSFASPQVVGAAILVWSLAPNLSSSEVRDILIQSAEDLGEPGKDLVYGYGHLNAQKAVEIAKVKLTKTYRE